MATPVAARVVEWHLSTYRRTWKASVFSAFVNPVLFLLAMGVALGGLVDAGRSDLGLPYLVFVASGLLAAQAMQTGAGDASWPVMAGMKWTKTYHAALATPVGVRDLVTGHLGWVGFRVTITSTAFLLVAAAFGAVPLGGGLLALLPAVLTGLAFAAPVTAFTATLEQPSGLSALFRFGIVPMFLFSGTFFPVEQLPWWLQPLAHLTPLWHGVQLTRAAALGVSTAFPVPVHAGFLVALVVGGWWLAIRAFSRRLRQ